MAGPTFRDTGHSRHMPSDCRKRQLRTRTSHTQHTGQWTRTEWAAATVPEPIGHHQPAAAAEERAGIGELLKFVAAAPDTSSCGKCRFPNRWSGNWTFVAEELRPIRPLATGTPHRFSWHLNSCSSSPYNHVKHDRLRHSWNRSHCS